MAGPNLSNVRLGGPFVVLPSPHLLRSRAQIGIPKRTTHNNESGKSKDKKKNVYECITVRRRRWRYGGCLNMVPRSWSEKADTMCSTAYGLMKFLSRLSRSL
jgi:hypothetical protein